MTTINVKGKLLDLSEPVVMGIINITPDSFYKGYRHHDADKILGVARNMIVQGAQVLDLGGQSTRPGSSRIGVQEEMDRVLPVLEQIHRYFPETILSVDTYYSKLAEAAVLAGASIVNDISAGSLDAEMIPTVAALKVPYIAMHMQGTPDTMQQQPTYGNVVKEVLEFFMSKVAQCREAGISDIIIDPGFGFGKNLEHNFSLLKSMHVFQLLQCPVMAGISRKGMIYKTLGSSAGEALNGTTAAHMLALLNGASLLRVHDVKEAVEAIKIFTAYKNAAL